MKICLNCGDTLLDAAKKCPICGNKKDFAVVDKNDSESIEQILASVPHPKATLSPKWKTSLVMTAMDQKRAAQQGTQKAMKRQSAKSITRQRIAENRKNAVACCPKCGSASLSTHQKGFGFGRGALGASFGLDVGLFAGGIGSKKLYVTCLNCGHRWKL